MQEFQSILDWIAAQKDILLRRLIEWSNINSGTGNVPGIRAQVDTIVKYAAALDSKIELREIPPWKTLDSRGNEIEKSLGPAISITKRPAAPLKIFLCIHSDTV